MPGIRYFERRHDKPIVAASPDMGMLMISARVSDAGHPQINDGAPPASGDSGLRGPQTKWGARAVIAGSVLGMAATFCKGVEIISTQQMIGLFLPAVLLIGAGLTAASNVSATEASGRGFHFGLQVGSNLGRLRSDAGRGTEF